MKVKAKNSREKLGLPTVFLVCSLFFFAGLFISTLLSHACIPLFLSGSRPVSRTLESEDDEDHGPILQGFELETARSVFSEICNCGAVAKMKLRPSTLALRKGETAESTKGARTRHSTFCGMRLAKTTILIMMHSIQRNMANRKAKDLLPSCCMCLMLKKVEKPCSLIENGAEMGMSYDYRKCIGLKIMPKEGDGLLFYSMFPNGTIDPTSLHGSCPVSKG
ncbi:unnamed protein product [Malus baccata var. baccata]